MNNTLKSRGWVDGALAAIRNPYGKSYVFGSHRSYSKYDEAAEFIKAGYSPEEYDARLDLRKPIIQLFRTAGKLQMVDYGAAYYPRLGGGKRDVGLTSA